MLVYPEIESWDEFYPSEIFILMGETDTNEDLLRVIKMANIGTTINLSKSPTITTTYKKIGVVETMGDLQNSLILLANISMGN